MQVTSAPPHEASSTDISITELSTESPSVQSLSRSTSTWTTMVSTMIKDLQIARRYLPNLLGTFVELGIRLAFFFLLASVITINDGTDLGQDLSGRNLFIFFQGALLLFVFNRATLGGPIQAVTEDLYNGTLEFLYSNPCSRYAYYVGTVLAKVIISGVIFLPPLSLPHFLRPGQYVQHSDGIIGLRNCLNRPHSYGDYDRLISAALASGRGHRGGPIHYV